METDQESEHASAQRKLMQVSKTTFINQSRVFETTKYFPGECNGFFFRM